jgi:hypothetical protein
MSMNMFRIYDKPCGELICTVAGDIETESQALALARKNDWVAQQMTEEACAFPCEEVGEW